MGFWSCSLLLETGTVGWVVGKTFIRLIDPNPNFFKGGSPGCWKEKGIKGGEGKHEMSVWNEGIIPNRTKVIIVYPTVSPEVVIVPIVCSIFIFPIVAFLIICCLKKRAARARQKARLARREGPYGEQSCASMAKFSPPPSGGQPGGRRFTTEVEMTTTVDLVTPDSTHGYRSDHHPKTSTPTSSSQEFVLGVLPILRVLETGMNSIPKNSC